MDFYRLLLVNSAHFEFKPGFFIFRHSGNVTPGMACPTTFPQTEMLESNKTFLVTILQLFI